MKPPQRSGVLALMLLLHHGPLSSSSSSSSGWFEDPALLSAATAAATAGCTIPSIAADALTAKVFEKRYLGRSPVLITGATAGWAAVTKWQRAPFLAAYGDLTLSSSPAATIVNKGANKSPFGNDPTIAELIGSFDDDRAASRPSYDFTFDPYFARDHPEVVGDCPTNTGHPAFSSWPGREPAASNPQPTPNKQSRAKGATYWNVLSLGASGRGLPFHSHGDSWIATVHGSKRWLMYAPGQRPASERSHLLHNSVDWLKHELEALPAERNPIDCVQKPGDIMYVPEGWEHATINLGDCIALAGQAAWLFAGRVKVGKKAVKFRKDDPAGNLALGIAYSSRLPESTEFALAEKHYLRVLRSDPFLGAGIGPLIKYLTKAAAADTTGKKSKVLVALLKKGSMRAQRAKVPNDVPDRSVVDALSMFARALDKAGDSATAAKLFRQAIKLDGANPTIRTDLGKLHAREEDFAAAAEHFGVAAGLQPGNLKIAKWLTQTQYQLHRRGLGQEL